MKRSKDTDTSTIPPDAFSIVSLLLFIIAQNTAILITIPPNTLSVDFTPSNFTSLIFWSASTTKFNDNENASKENNPFLAPGIASYSAVNTTNPAAILASISKRS